MRDAGEFGQVAVGARGERGVKQEDEDHLQPLAAEHANGRCVLSPFVFPPLDVEEEGRVLDVRVTGSICVPNPFALQDLSECWRDALGDHDERSRPIGVIIQAGSGSRVQARYHCHIKCVVGAAGHTPQHGLGLLIIGRAQAEVASGPHLPEDADKLIKQGGVHSYAVQYLGLYNIIVRGEIVY